MNTPRAPHARRNALVALLFLLLPFLLTAIVLTLSALFSSPEPRRPAVTALLLP